MLRKKRDIEVTVVKEYNTFVDSVKTEKVVIFVIGDLYNEVKRKASNSNACKSNKVMGGIGIVATILTGGTVLPLLMAGLMVSGIVADDFKKYTVKINKKLKRIELYLKKGPEKYDSNYDTLIYEG